MTLEDYEDYLRIKKVVEALKDQGGEGVSMCIYGLIDWMRGMDSAESNIKIESLKFKGIDLGDVTITIRFEDA
jgi:hypothetical protein